MVFRMDLLPEFEQIHFLKIGMFGFQRSIVVNIKDLERVHYNKDYNYQKKWSKSVLWVPREDKKLVYRDVKTQEIFTFSIKGIWNKKGLEHELLN